MSFSTRLKNIIKVAFTDAKARVEFLNLFEDTVGTLVAAGTFTTAGGDASEVIPVTGALSTDIALVLVKTPGAVPVVVNAAAAVSGEIDVTMSGDPSTDHVLSYVLFRTA